METKDKLKASDLENLWDKGCEEGNLDTGAVFNRTIRYCYEMEKKISSLEQQIADSDFFQVFGEWTVKTFPEANSVGHLHKLKEEVDEAIKDPSDISEYADCQMALFGAAFKAGFTQDQLMDACKAKHAINKTRTWKKGNNGTYQHIKDSEQIADSKEIPPGAEAILNKHTCNLMSFKAIIDAMEEYAAIMVKEALSNNLKNK